jgi:hypothetical protein
MPDRQELRIAYAMTATARGKKCCPLAYEVLAEPKLKAVFKAAIERGFAVARSPPAGIARVCGGTFSWIITIPLKEPAPAKGDAGAVSWGYRPGSA